jgi:predicted RNA-binding protein
MKKIILLCCIVLSSSISKAQTNIPYGEDRTQIVQGKLSHKLVNLALNGDVVNNEAVYIHFAKDTVTITSVLSNKDASTSLIFYRKFAKSDVTTNEEYITEDSSKMNGQRFLLLIINAKAGSVRRVDIDKEGIETPEEIADTELKIEFKPEDAAILQEVKAQFIQWIGR